MTEPKDLKSSGSTIPIITTLTTCILMTATARFSTVTSFIIIIITLRRLRKCIERSTWGCVLTIYATRWYFVLQVTA
jgi:hypothetical protein